MYTVLCVYHVGFDMYTVLCVYHVGFDMYTVPCRGFWVDQKWYFSAWISE